MVDGTRWRGVAWGSVAQRGRQRLEQPCGAERSPEQSGGAQRSPEEHGWPEAIGAAPPGGPEEVQHKK